MAGETFRFFGFKRSTAAERPGLSLRDGRLEGSFQLALQDVPTGQQTPMQAVHYRLLGPADVRGVRPGAVTRTYPVAGATGVDPDKCAYAELAEGDLPWRYTPEASAGNVLRPWIVLVVGTSDEVRLLPGGRVELRGVVRTAHDLAQSARWAHLQVDLNGRETARLLSPRDLEPLANQQLTAVIVPAFTPTGADAWAAGDGSPVILPAYLSWSFTRSDTTAGFQDLALRLTALPAPPGLGYAPLAYRLDDVENPLPPRLLVGGALVSPGSLPPGVNDPLASLGETQQAVADALAHLAQTQALPSVGNGNTPHPKDDKGRPIVQMPRYGDPWVDDWDNPPLWGRQLNGDPRARGPAGLGLWAGIVLQEEIAGAATAQLGAFYAAAQRIRQLTLGLAAARSLWNNRLPSKAVDPGGRHRLMIYGPSLGRFVTPEGVSALDHVTAPGRPLPPALFSSAARRMLRRGTVHARLAEAGATTPAAILEAANDCMRFWEPLREAGAMPHLDRVGPPLDDLARDIPGVDVHLDEGHLDLAALQGEQDGDDSMEWNVDMAHLFAIMGNELGALRDAAAAAVTPEPDRGCVERRVNLDGLSAALDDALDPTGDNPFIVRRVLDTMQGLDDQPLTPPELCLDFHLPAWQFLNHNAPEWLLPGVGEMHITRPGPDGQPEIEPDKDPVVAVETNARFTDAFMVGFNQQALAELRWRNVPVQVGCTPLRRFWEPASLTDPDKTTEDLRGVHLWGDTPLGDETHETPEAQGDNLVLVFKTELFRRYPNTLVYLAARSNPAQDAAGNWTEKLPGQPTHIDPILHVAIGRDVVLFGFKEPPDILLDHWVVVEEVPQGFTFFSNEDAVTDADPAAPDLKALFRDAKDGGHFAQAAFADPIRVAIQGTLMLPTP